MRRWASRMAVVVLVGILVGLAGTAPAAAAGPKRRADYRFQNTLASSKPGAPPLQRIGGSQFGAVMTPGGSRTALRFRSGAGLRLRNVTDVIPRRRYTIAVRFSFSDTSSYRRILNFKPDRSPSADTGLYVHDTALRFYNITHDELGSIDDNELVWVVLTRRPGGQVRGYAFGHLIFSFNDRHGRAMVGGNDVLRFFRDNGNREESAGYVRRILLYDRPLSDQQIADLESNRIP